MTNLRPRRGEAVLTREGQLWVSAFLSFKGKLCVVKDLDKEWLVDKYEVDFKIREVLLEEKPCSPTPS